jgi:hypothetical protein
MKSLIEIGVSLNTSGIIAIDGIALASRSVGISPPMKVGNNQIPFGRPRSDRISRRR